MEYPGHRQVGMLGKGSYGEADLFVNEATDKLKAVKFLRGCDIDDRMEVYVKREIRNHQLLCGHPAIIQLQEVFLTHGCLGIALDFAAGGDLQSHILRAGRFSEDVARYFFQQLIAGVAWCHSKGVCHRDLKLQNLLIDKPLPREALHDFEQLLERKPQLKLCDFGTSKSAELDTRPDTLLGTPAYTAPELFTASGKGGGYSGEAADVWACGVTLYFMLVGDMPFIDPKNARVTPKLVHAAEWSIPDGVEVSAGCQDLLGRIFVPDPHERISMAGIQRHFWFRQNLPKGQAGAGGGAAPARRRTRFLCFSCGEVEEPDPAAFSPTPPPAAPLPHGAAQSEGEIDQLIKAARSSCTDRRSNAPPGKPGGPGGPGEDGSFMSEDALVTMGGTAW